LRAPGHPCQGRRPSWLAGAVGGTGGTQGEHRAQGGAQAGEGRGKGKEKKKKKKKKKKRKSVERVREREMGGFINIKKRTRELDALCEIERWGDL